MSEFPNITNFAARDLLKGGFGGAVDRDYFENEEDDTRVLIPLFKNRKVPINDLLWHFGVFGKSGSGKTVTLATLLEFIAENDIGFTCWDWEGTSFYTIPEVYKKVRFTKLEPLLSEDIYEEYLNNQTDKGFKQFFSNTAKQLNFHKVPEAQNKLKALRDLAEKNYLTSTQQIFTFEKIPNLLMKGAITWTYMQRIFELASELTEASEQVLHIAVYDEAQWAMPSLTADEERTIYTQRLLEQNTRIVSQGRKRWLLLYCASQRLPKISVNIRTQLKNVILQQASGSDLSYYEEFMRNISLAARKAYSASMLQAPSGAALFVRDGWVIPFCQVTNRKSRHPDENATLFKARGRAEKKRREFNERKVDG